MRMVSTRSKPISEKAQIMVLSRPIDNFKAAVLRVAADNLDRPLTEAEVARIECDIASKAHILSHLPNHPPYATMIRTSLQELNEEGGSSEDSISDFIKEEFPDLPWAHSAYLKHHLLKLCNRDEILVNSENLYLLVDENTPNSASFKMDKHKTELRGTRGGSCKKRNKAKEKQSTSGLEVAVLEEKNEAIKEHNQEQQEHKPMRIRFRLSENESAIKTVVSDLPLALIDEDQHVLDCNGLGTFSKTPLGFDENVKKLEGKLLKPAYQNKKPEATSTTALILNLARANSQPHEKVKCRGRGRPRKNESFGESEAENFQPRRRGRAWKESEVEIFQKRQQPNRRGRPRKVDS